MKETRKQLPEEIEQESFRTIERELEEMALSAHAMHTLSDVHTAAVVKRCIHTSADFDYAENLYFSDGVTGKIADAIRRGVPIVTDTEMAKAGINKRRLAAYGCEVHCFMSDPDVAESAKKAGTTRAVASVDKASELSKNLGPVIYVVGNAPTALFRIRELFEAGSFLPEAVIAAPVGFVNVVEAKEEIFDLPVPYIVARGRKGGSNIAACIVNAILYDMEKK